MGMYVKGYAQRGEGLIAAIAVVIAALLLCLGLFRGKLNKVCGQISNYDAADYNIIYILNYGEWLDNECIYPDTDVQIFFDATKQVRLTVSSIMKEDTVNYSLSYLIPLSDLQNDEICVSDITAKQYGINIGDVLYADYPYSSSPVPLTVKQITDTEYDYLKPDIGNNIGVAFLGYDENYRENTLSKYILFSDVSKADILSEYPQIINSIINKSANRSKVADQATAPFVFLCLFFTVSIVLSHMLFFGKSEKYLYRCYLKGMRKNSIVIIPFLEKIFFCLVPCSLIQFLITSFLTSGMIRRVYRALPVCVIGAYCMIFLFIDSLHYRKKGC